MTDTPAPHGEQIPPATRDGHPAHAAARERVRVAIYLFLSAAIYACSFHYFVAPAHFAPGGVGGLVAIMKFLLPATEQAGQIDLSPLLLLLLNFPLLLLTRRHLSRDFMVKTMIEAVVMTACLFVLDNFIDPSYRFSLTGTAVTGDVGMRLIAAIFGGICCGLSLYCALAVNASTGGTDIVGTALQRRMPDKSVPAMIFAVNSVIVLISIFVYRENLTPVFLAFIYMFASARTCDTIMCGAKSAMKFEVVTEYGEQISRDIISTLGHGVTLLPARGMYERTERSLLICVIQPRQVVKFKNIIARYPNTFAYIGTVNEIIGKFNQRRD